MIQIYDDIFVGGENDYEFGVKTEEDWAVVHACKEPYHRNALGYSGRSVSSDHPEYLVARRGHRLILNMVDVENPKFFDKGMIEEALDFVDEQLENGNKVLIHCNQGESRGPSLGLLYLSSRLEAIPNNSFSDAEEAFRKLYPPYAPKSGIRGHIKQNWVQYCQISESGWDK